MESQLLPFIHHCYESKKLTQDQYEICLSQCLDQTDLQVFHDCLSHFNLLGDFERYIQNYKHQLKLNKFQQEVLSKRISKLTAEIQSLEAEICRLKNQIDPEVIVRIEYWKDRLKRFPENPRFQAEIDKHQRLIDLNLASYQPLEVTLTEIKDKRERLFTSLGDLVTSASTPLGQYGYSGSSGSTKVPDLI